MAELPTSDEEFSYYAVLNVPRDASDDDIKKAYRSLASAYHPDKHADASEQAAAQFMRLHEAYEVLTNPQRRLVYDIYGREGLASGLEVGTKLASRDELREQWERFQQQQAARKEAAQVAYRGLYLLRLDAASLLQPYDPQVSRAPEISNIAMTSQVQAPVDDKTVATIGGQVSVKRNLGGGSFVCGLKRHFSAASSGELQAVVGLRSLVSCAAWRQLGPHTSASLAATWQRGAGLGLQVTSTRQLSAAWDGEATWVVGPRQAAGVLLALTRRGDRYVASLRIEVGLGLGLALALRLVRRFGETGSARGSVRVGLAGWEVELGASRRISQSASASLAVATGSQGVVAKGSFTRVGQQFVFPVLLSHDLDLRIVAAAYLLPPAVSYVSLVWLYRPWARHRRLRKALEARRTKAAEIWSAIKAARQAQELVQPVAQRKLAREVAQDGLVVVEATFGVLPPLSLQPGQDQQPAHSPGPAGAASPGRSAAEDSASDDEDVDGETRAALAADPAAQLPPAWIDVTPAVRFLVEDGHLVFYPGVSKVGLMGFCDPAPGQHKRLRILCVARGRPCRVELDEQEGSQLPAPSSALADPADADIILTEARQQQLLSDTSPHWSDCAVYSPNGAAVHGH